MSTRLWMASAVDRIDCAGEFDQHAIAHRLDDAARVFLDQRFNDALA
jgi:hypothetical protein